MTTTTCGRAQTPKKRKKKGRARMFTRTKQHKNTTQPRIFEGPGPQRIVKPTPPSSPSSDKGRSHLVIEVRKSLPQPEAPVTVVEPSHYRPSDEQEPHDADNTQSEQQAAESLQVTVNVQQQELEDVEMVDVSEAPTPTHHAFSILIDEAASSIGQATDDQDNDLPETLLAGTNELTTRVKVHFSETDHIQPYIHLNLPQDVKNLPAFTRPTSDKISFLRNPNMYDSNIRLHVRGSALEAPLLLIVANLKDMEGLWVEAKRLGKLETEPHQVQFRLEEDSQPAGYDTNEDEKRFRFGKRANDNYPEFVKRCQEAARAKADSADESRTDADAASPQALSKSGTERRGQHYTKYDVFGVVDFIWR